MSAISRFPVPASDDLPEDVRDVIMANLADMRPNAELYAMGRDLPGPGESSPNAAR